jgi:hypothetical protein
MKINEVCSPLKRYLATVRVVTKSGSATARTEIKSDAASNAFMMLTRIYGLGNVINLSEIVCESLRSTQIQREAPLTPPTVQRVQQPQRGAQKRSYQARRSVQRLPSARPIPDALKHQKIQQRLTRQFVRQSNIVRPTSDDIRIAKTNAETELKRADLEYRKREEERERRLASAWRRR